MPWQRARATARAAAVRPLPAAEADLADALGRALAEPLVARTDLPPFDTSAMDGWAVAGPGPWVLRGRVLAGQQPAGPLADGTAVRIATGAPLPPGATAVLRREHGTVERRGTPGRDGGAAAADPGEDTGVLHDRAPRPAEPGRDVRPRGQECRRGEPLLPAGTAVTPAVLGLAAAAGCDRLAVHRRPTVELLLLGDELLESGPPRDGLVRDALGPLLVPWLEACGAGVVGRRMVRDDRGLLRDALRRSPADVVVTTGGTAAGPVDFLHAALDEAGGRLLVDSVAVRPGHPMLLAALPPAAPGGAPRTLVGLPGNPLAAVAGAATLAVPLLRALGGHPAAAPRRAPAAADLAGHPRDTRLLPVRLTARGADPLAFDGPAMLRGFALADALAAVPPGGLAAGEPVELLEAPGR
ncbi:molybdopterin molybdotransferase MoeA [Streptomyces sp. NPDC001380]|uniref:molybdopterin molybdotransferase MoeA n=1 Tax=Streptomyces sp. NPDC001380 TaxID=3364566 RepID=UPI00367ADE47